MYCLKCKARTELSRHHIFPRRFFPEEKATIKLCLDCHADLEEVITALEYRYGRQRKLPREEYLIIAANFLNGEVA